MGQFLIPTNSDTPFPTQRTTLEGREFLLKFFYNQSENVWYISFYDTNEDLILGEVKIITNWPLLRRRKWDPRLPPGEIYCLTNSQDDRPPGFGEMGGARRCQLNYVDAEGQAELGLPVGAT